MGIFKKNPNEINYPGGEKHWADVIKNSGDASFLVWRQPEEDFNTNSTLIVLPGEEAIFIKGGIIEQVFENGTYKLETSNYPFITRLRTAFTGGISTFNCVVYFLKKAHSLEILWGTEAPIQVRDKLVGIETQLKARGSYKIQIENSAKFLEKLIGNNDKPFTSEGLNNYFSNQFQSIIRSNIASVVNESQTELLGIESKLMEISETVSPHLERTLNEYGLRLINFTLAAIVFDSDELRKKYDEIGISALEKLRTAQADKLVFETLGADWTKLQQAEILKLLAKNEGGGLVNMGAGLGFGLTAGSQMADLSNQFLNNSSLKTNADDAASKLKQLKELLDLGLISQEDYDTKKDEILKNL